MSQLLALLLVAAAAEECVLVFEVSAGETRNVVFSKKPLGMDFNKELGLVVKRVYGHAEELGVQPHWKVIAAGGEDLQGVTYKEGLSVIKALSSSITEEWVPTAVEEVEAEEKKEAPDLETLLPESVQDKLAGLMAGLDGMEGLDASTKALLGALLPKTGLAAEAAEELKEMKEHAGTDDLEGLMAQMGGRLSGAMARGMGSEDSDGYESVDLDEERHGPSKSHAERRKAHEERMEQMRQERRNRDAGFEETPESREPDSGHAERMKGHEERMEAMRVEREERKVKHTAEMERLQAERARDKAAREEEKQKRDEEWAAGRKKHNDYMAKAEERREKQKARREEMERKREERDSKMEDVLRQAAEHMSSLKGAGMKPETLDALKEAQKAMKSETTSETTSRQPRMNSEL